MQSAKQFPRYIPVTIKAKLDTLEYDRKDDLYTIIDLIYRKEIHFKTEYQNKYGYTEISLRQFSELIPSKAGLPKALQFLIDNRLILRNEYYVIGVKSKAYKIPQEYLGKTLPVVVNDKNINKRILEQIKSYKAFKVKNLEFAQSRYFKTFKIDTVGAYKAILTKTKNEIQLLAIKLNISLSDADVQDIINCASGHELKRFGFIVNKEGRELDNILHRYMVYMTRVNAINDGFLFFKRNDTNGRLDTNLTSLPSFLRPYIIADEQLVNVDIKNSQPYFLYTLLKNDLTIDKTELAKYAELVIDGTLYEFMVKEYFNQTSRTRTREQMKKMMYKIFFSKVESFAGQKAFFGSLFPTIMNFINTTNELKNNTLAIMLQTKESFTILDVIMPLLATKGIKPYTIHDSFVCLQSEALTIKTLFTEKLTEMYGIAPALHCDFILPSEEQLLASEEMFDIDTDLDLIEAMDFDELTVFFNPDIIKTQSFAFTRIQKQLKAA